MGLLKRNGEAIAQILRIRDRLSTYLEGLETIEETIGVIPMARSANNGYQQAISAVLKKTAETALDMAPALSICVPPDTVVVPTIFDFSIVLNCRDDSHLITDAFISTEKSETVLMLKAAEYADCFFDIGANIGYYSLLFAVAADAPITVYAFEPAKDVYARFCRAVALNNQDCTIMAFNMALGDSPREMDMIIHRQGSGGNSLSESFISQDDNTGLRQTTPVTTLDIFIEENNIPTPNAVVKIDTEGFEGRVLRGGKAFFTSPQHPVILIETLEGRGKGEDSDRRVLTTLADWGYNVYSVGAFTPGAPIIFPTFSWGLMKRSKKGNYIAFHENHNELKRWCLSPEPSSILTSNKRINRLQSFQNNTIDSINAYIRHLKRTFLEDARHLSPFQADGELDRR